MLAQSLWGWHDYKLSRRVPDGAIPAYAGIMRLFVGVALSDEARQAMERVGLRLRSAEDGMRWSTPEQWHITLAFLGEVGAADESVLVRELRRVRQAPVPLTVDGMGIFERVGILYAAVELTPGLEALQRAAAAAVKAAGLAIEDRAYRPHVTLARSKGRLPLRNLKRFKPMLEQHRPRVHWTAAEFLLYESQLSPSGARYVVRARFPLDSGL